MAVDLDADEVRLRVDAEALLEERGLKRILEKFGNPHPTGSFLLRVMARRHLEIYMEVNNLLERDFFVMGGELVATFAPLKATYLNTRFSRVEGIASGLCWDLFLGEDESNAWRVTITAMEPYAYRDRMGFDIQLADKLTPAHRLHILAIIRGLIAEGYSSDAPSDRDVWHAVIDDGVCSLYDLKEVIGGSNGI